MENMFYLDDSALNKFLSILIVMDIEVLKVLSKRGADGIVSEIKNDVPSYEDSSLIKFESDEDTVDNNYSFGLENESVSFSTIDKFSNEDLRGNFIRMKVKELISRLDEFTIERDGSSVEEFSKNDVIDVFIRLSPLFLFYYVLNLGISIGLFVKNRNFLGEVYNYPASFDIFEPGLCNFFGSLDLFINKIEYICIKDRKFLIERQKSEEGRFLFFARFFNFIKDLKQDSINKIIIDFIDKSRKFMNKNYDIIFKKFRYLVEKYFNLPVIYILDIINLFILYCITNFVLKYVDNPLNSIMTVEDFLKSIDSSDSNKNNSFSPFYIGSMFSSIGDEVKAIEEELKNIRNTSKKISENNYSLDNLSISGSKVFHIDGKKLVQIGFKKDILCLN